VFNPIPDRNDEPEESAAQMPPVQDSASANQGADDEAYTYALECLLKGSKPADIRKSLIDAGYSRSQADRFVQTAIDFQREHEAVHGASERRKGGGLLVAVGLVLWIAGALVRMGRPTEGFLVCILLTDILGLVLVVGGIARFVWRRRAGS
jgi:hypothetical protein